MEEYNNILNYVAERDAKLIQDACVGIGTKEAIVTSVVCHRSKKQIAAIDAAYRTLSGDYALKTALTSECGGNYGSFLGYLCQSRGAFLAEKLQKTMSGLTCDKNVVNEIFCSNHSLDLLDMRKYYEDRTDKQLPDLLRDWLSGEHLELMLSLLINGRSNEDANAETAALLAEKIYSKIKKGSCMLGGLTDNAEHKVADIIGTASVDQCQAIKAAWDTAGYMEKSLEAVIKEKMSSDLGNACLLLMSDPIDSTCVKLKEALGDVIGCDEDTVSRLLGGVDKDDAMEIRDRYKEKYDSTLEDALKAKIGSEYQNAVIAWITAEDPTGGMQDELLDEDASDSAVKLKVTTTVSRLKQAIAAFDADLLSFAKQGVGTDERMVVDIICRRTKAQLDAIDMAYREKNDGSTLKDYIESNTGGNLKEFLSYAQMKEDEFDSAILQKAFSGIGCNKAVVVEVLCTRTYRRLKAARTKFENSTDTNLLDRIRGEMSGPLCRLCVRLLAGPRGGAADFDAEAVATSLYDSGAGKIGTDENAIVEIFTGHTLEQMKEVVAAYDMKFNSSLASAISSEFSGNIEIALSGLLCDPQDLFCRSIKDSMSSFGTDESVLNRCIGGNDKKNVKIIADKYFEKYDVNLCETVSADLSGDYKCAVVNFISLSDPTNGLELTPEEVVDAEEQAAAEAAAALREAMEKAKADAEAEAAAIEEARKRDEERAAAEAERRQAELDAQREAAEAAKAEAAAKLAQLEAEKELMRLRLEEAKLAREAAEQERKEAAEALREEREAARQAMLAEAQRLAEERDRIMREEESRREAERMKAEEEGRQAEYSSESSSSDSDDDDDEDLTDEQKAYRAERKRRRQEIKEKQDARRSEDRKKMRERREGADEAKQAAKKAAKEASKNAKKEARKAMKGLKKFGKKKRKK